MREKDFAVNNQRRLLGLLSTAIVVASVTGSFGEPTNASLKHADITFILPTDPGANTIFRKRLIEFGTARQLRNGPVAVGGGLLGSPTYVVAIFGSCDGVTDVVLPAIEYAASNLPLHDAIVSSYRKTVECVEKDVPDGEDFDELRRMSK